MRYSGLVLAFILLAGCGASTNIIDVSWDDTTVHDRAADIGAGGEGTVEFLGPSRIVRTGGHLVEASRPVSVIEGGCLPAGSLWKVEAELRA
jgi:hypothetical protein